MYFPLNTCNFICTLHFVYIQTYIFCTVNMHFCRYFTLVCLSSFAQFLVKFLLSFFMETLLFCWTISSLHFFVQVDFPFVWPQRRWGDHKGRDGRCYCLGFHRIWDHKSNPKHKATWNEKQNSFAKNLKQYPKRPCPQHYHLNSGLPVDGGEHRVGRTKPGFVSFLKDKLLSLEICQHSKSMFRLSRKWTLCLRWLYHWLWIVLYLLRCFWMDQ